MSPGQLRSHIPIGGPARREPVNGTETAMRVSLGFEPSWFSKRVDVEERQRQSGFPIDQLSVSNCVVNMISPKDYETFVMPHDARIAIFQQISPCDIVLADIQSDTPDERVQAVVQVCHELEETGSTQTVKQSAN